MLTQLQLEGPELEPLLARVRSELGGSARIVSAEKVRSGGIGGFFARQRFELTVEVDDEQPPPASTPAAPALAAPRLGADEPAPTGAGSAQPMSLLDLAEQVNDEEQAAVVSTESPTFASLLSQLGAAVGTPDAAARSVPEPSSPTPSSAVRTEFAAAGTADRRDVARDAVLPRTTAEVSRAVTPRSRIWPPVAAADAEGSTTSAQLARLGLPAHLHPSCSDAELHMALRASLARLPTAPPATNRAGGVLALVGPLALALRVAREIAQELGLPPTTSVAVATSAPTTSDVLGRQVLRQRGEAEDRRAAWRRRGNLTVVAVDAPLTSTGAADAREFLAALAPSTTWGVVEATRKAQDIGAWSRALGGVHALALTDVEQTADPAAVLELGIPVSRLGARPATPRVWATLLTGRLAA